MVGEESGVMVGEESTLPGVKITTVRKLLEDLTRTEGSMNLNSDK